MAACAGGGWLGGETATGGGDIGLADDAQNPDDGVADARSTTLCCRRARPSLLRGDDCHGVPPRH